MACRPLATSIFGQMSTPLVLAVSLIAFGMIASRAAAQTTFRRNTFVPTVLNGGDSTATVLEQQCDYQWNDRFRTLPANRVVQRVVTVNPKLTILVTDTLSSYDVDGGSPNIPVRVEFTGRKRLVDTSAYDGFRGDVVVDPAVPFILRVNVYGADATAKMADPIPGATAKRCQLSFTVRNRFDLGFSSEASGFSAISIPFRVRPSFRKNDVNVQSEVVTGPTLGVALSHSWYKTRYMYEAGKSNAVRISRRRAVGGLVAFSNGTAEKTSTRTAKASLADGSKAAFVSVLPGFTATVGVFGIDLGLSVGTEHVIGSKEARSWDRNGRPWYGINFGYSFFKFPN